MGEIITFRPDPHCSTDYDSFSIWYRFGKLFLHKKQWVDSHYPWESSSDRTTFHYRFLYEIVILNDFTDFHFDTSLDYWWCDCNIAGLKCQFVCLEKLFFFSLNPIEWGIKIKDFKRPLRKHICLKIIRVDKLLNKKYYK